MHELTGKCSMCGMCCKAIIIPLSPEKIKDIVGSRGPEEEGDPVFVHYNWEPISEEEALEINPHLRNWPDHGNQRYFYRCTKFDPETNKCSIHGKRPQVCSGYPWYNKPPKITEPFYNPNCGYLVDREQAIAQALGFETKVEFDEALEKERAEAELKEALEKERQDDGEPDKLENVS